MHRRFGVPYHLALNGGVLVLTAHDCPDDLAACAPTSTRV